MYIKIIGEAKEAMAIMQNNVPRQTGDILKFDETGAKLLNMAPTIFVECDAEGNKLKKQMKKEKTHLPKDNKMLKKSYKTKEK